MYRERKRDSIVYLLHESHLITYREVADYWSKSTVKN